MTLWSFNMSCLGMGFIFLESIESLKSENRHLSSVLKNSQLHLLFALLYLPSTPMFLPTLYHIFHGFYTLLLPVCIFPFSSNTISYRFCWLVSSLYVNPKIKDRESESPWTGHPEALWIINYSLLSTSYLPPSTLLHYTASKYHFQWQVSNSCHNAYGQYFSAKWPHNLHI